MSLHHAYVPELPPSLHLAGPVFRLAGDEAHHVLRSRRGAEGDRVRLCDGRGRVMLATIAGIARDRDGWIAILTPESLDAVAPTSPRVWVYAPAPKHDRLHAMIEQLSQAGAAGWSPLLTARTVVEPRTGGSKLGSLARVAVESLKQSGRAWTMQIGEPVLLEAALATETGAAAAIVLAGQGGSGVAPVASSIAVFVGPEGGWTQDELDAITRKSGGQLSLGPHVLRLETAAVLGVAACMAANAATSHAASARSP